MFDMNQTTIQVYCTPSSDLSSNCSDNWETYSSTSWSPFEDSYVMYRPSGYFAARPSGQITIIHNLSPHSSRNVSCCSYDKTTSRICKTRCVEPRRRRTQSRLVERRRSVSGNRHRISRSPWDDVLVNYEAPRRRSRCPSLYRSRYDFQPEPPRFPKWTINADGPPAHIPLTIHPRTSLLTPSISFAQVNNEEDGHPALGPQATVPVVVVAPAQLP